MKPGSKVLKSDFIKQGKLFSDQYVDIIIPFHGQYEKVASLVSSLIYLTRSNHFRICLVDDCSPNSNFVFDGFEDVPNLKSVQTEEQLGFGGALEYGMKAMENEPNVFPWVVFLHSDCLIEDANWLLAMGQTMQKLKAEGVKMVGSRTNNPTVEDVELKNKLYAERHAEPTEDVVLEEGYLPLYCALCHRHLFHYIKGFIKHYPYAGYENRELADRMRSYGYKQAVCGSSWVHHEGDATLQYLRRTNPHAKKIMEGNKNLYMRDIASK